MFPKHLQIDHIKLSESVRIQKTSDSEVAFKFEDGDHGADSAVVRQLKVLNCDHHEGYFIVVLQSQQHGKPWRVQAFNQFLLSQAGPPPFEIKQVEPPALAVSGEESNLAFTVYVSDWTPLHPGVRTQCYVSTLDGKTEFTTPAKLRL